MPLAGLTAYQAIRRTGLQPHETVLIHGAAGDVGSLGVQIAAALGARVIATTSERNHDFVRSLGAVPVAYGAGLRDRVREQAPQGVDAAVDFAGGDAVDVRLQVLDEPSRLASVVDPEAAAQGGHYVWVRPDRADLAALAALADDGWLTVHLDRVLPISEAAEVWRISQGGHTRGKLVLSVTGH